MSLLIYGIDNYYNIYFERIVVMLLTPVFAWKVNRQSKARQNKKHQKQNNKPQQQKNTKQKNQQKKQQKTKQKNK